MSEPAGKIATYDDLYNIPENMTGEIINGELIVSPRPARRHIRAASIMGMKIGSPYDLGEGDGPGGWIILIEPEIGFGDHITIPDLAGWKKERFPKEEPHNWIGVTPDWVCEIFSPGSALRDRTDKKIIYGEYGVGHLWLVDPLNMILEAFRLENGQWVPLGVFGGKQKARIEPFQEIEIYLGDLWLE